MTNFEMRLLTSDKPFSEDGFTYLPSPCGIGKLVFAYPNASPMQISLVGAIKKGEVCRINGVFPLSLNGNKFVENKYPSLADKQLPMQEEINLRLINEVDIPKNYMDIARGEAKELLYGLHSKESNKIRLYSAIKRIIDLNLPVRLSDETALDFFLEKKTVEDFFPQSTDKSPDYYRIALCKIYLNELSLFALSEKEQSILDALNTSDKFTISFIDGKKTATGYYKRDEIIEAYETGFPPPAPGHISWENISKIYEYKRGFTSLESIYCDEELLEEREER